jgi:hypothetical protein
LGNLIGPVRASILNDQDFRFKILPAKKSKDLLQCWGQAFFLVMGWDDDG